MPANGALKLTGHGYGHGHGMSQYGARGRRAAGAHPPADPGLLLPGHDARHDRRQIRVLITADTDNDVRVVPASGLRVREVGGSASYILPTTGRTTTWRLRTVGGSTVLDYYNGSWHTYDPAARHSAAPRSSTAAGASALRVAGTTRAYRGALRLDGRTR